MTEYQSLTPLQIEQSLTSLPDRIAKTSMEYRQALENLETVKNERAKIEAIAYIEESKEKLTVKAINAKITVRKDVQDLIVKEIKTKGELEEAKIAMEQENNKFNAIRKLVNLRSLEYKHGA